MTGGRLVDDLVLEHPGELVRDKYGMESGCEGRIDVRAWTVADHPGVGADTVVAGRELEIGAVVFFGEDLDGCEVWGEA